MSSQVLLLRLLGQALSSARSVAPAQLATPCRASSSKHYDIKWRELRKKKVIKVNLLDFDKMRAEQKMDLRERRENLKKENQTPPRQFQEIPINISSTSAVFEPYIPPEGDGKLSLISSQGAKQKMSQLTHKGKSMNELRKIRKFEDVDTSVFAAEAHQTYEKAHSLLCSYKDDELALRELVTEKAFSDMTQGLSHVTLRWRLAESVEPARVVHVRTTDLLSKDNIYGQITVRLHTMQQLAVYDRFGRLMFGDPHVTKAVLEYVVFEKHLSNLYGRWRIHDKISPAWRQPGDMRGVVRRTYRQRQAPEVNEETNELEEQKEVTPAATA